MIFSDRDGTEAEPTDGILPPGDAPPERLLRLAHWTSTASRHLRRRIGELTAALELSDSELIVVWLCGGGGRVQVDLAAATGISPAQMSGLMERLRSRGLVAMHRLARDRRRQIWRATAEGQSLLVSAAQHLNDLAACLADHLSDEEQRVAQSLCQRLAEAAASGSRSAGKPSAAAPGLLHPECKEAA
ncbi:MAG TPA: MarR family winged helix-turn-helix transcriptional regulator [Pirellulaceae bacterium]|jgi:DNA-binding MarR family transcriptional regulator